MGQEANAVQRSGAWVLLIGPSSAGKTDLAFRLADQLRGEVINADKFYLYSGFPSSTGMPDFSKYPAVQTHLYGILKPEMPCLTEQEFGMMARESSDKCRSRCAIPIVEGCYYRFARAALDAIRPDTCVLMGIKWPRGTNVHSRVEARVNEIFHERGGIEEVREALRLGHRDTYVMRMGSMVAPLVEYLDGTITLDAAKEKAVVEILSSAYKAYRKFLDFPGITWVEHDPVNTDATLKVITREVSFRIGDGVHQSSG